MRCHSALAPLVLPLCFVSIAGLSACGGSNSGVASAASADALIGLELSDSGVTLDNRTGTTLVKGELTVIPMGVRQPFFIVLPRIQSGEKRTFALDQFRTNDGTQFNRSLARAKAVKISATDLNGKAHEYEIPFE